MKIRFTASTGLLLVILQGSLADLVGAVTAPNSATAGQAGVPAQSSNDFQLGPSQAATGTSPPPPPHSESWFDEVLTLHVPLKFGIVVAETSSDNIFYQPKGTADYITEISPFVVLTLGTPIKLAPALDEETIYDKSDSGDLNYLQITARPTITLYDKNPDLNVVDEYEDAVYAHQFAKFTVSIEQKYEKLSQPTIENTAVGTLVNRDIYTTTARTSYIYSDKLSTYGTANQIINDYKSNLYTNSNEWNAEYYFLYQFFPKLSLGLGPKIGLVDVAKAPNQRYQNMLFHAFYPATGKLSFAVAAGAQFREYQDHSQPVTVSPVFEGQAIYRPFDSMVITLNAFRDRVVSNSQLGADYDSSTVSVQVRQRFLQVVYLTLGGGYLNDQYNGGDAAGPQREDNVYFTSAGLTWSSKDWLTLSGSYQFIKDDSNINIFSFEENRFTVSATLKY